MGLLNIPKLVDYRNKVAKHKTKKYVNRTKGVNSITDIAIHHSLTLRKLAGSNAEGYARYHVNNLGWPGIGYTYVIEADGTIKYVNDIEKKSYHVGNHNNYAVGIVLSGDFRNEEPTSAQCESLRNLVAALQKKYPHIKNVKGHSDYKGYEQKACPVFDYKKVLADTKKDEIKTESPKKETKPSKNDTKAPKKETKQATSGKLKIDGYLGQLTISDLQRYFKTPVDGVLSKPSLVIKALQRFLNQHGAKLKVDGYFGPLTIKALQRYLGTPQDGVLSRPSLVIKELQRRLNKGKL